MTASSALTALVVGVATALWSGLSGMAATRVAMDAAYDVPEDRTFLEKRLVGMVLDPGDARSRRRGGGLLVFGQPIGSVIRSHLPGGSWFVWASTIVRWVLTVLSLTTLFAVFYYLAPEPQAAPLGVDLGERDRGHDRLAGRLDRPRLFCVEVW